MLQHLEVCCWFPSLPYLLQNCQIQLASQKLEFPVIYCEAYGCFHFVQFLSSSSSMEHQLHKMNCMIPFLLLSQEVLVDSKFSLKCGRISQGNSWLRDLLNGGLKYFQEFSVLIKLSSSEVFFPHRMQNILM